MLTNILTQSNISPCSFIPIFPLICMYCMYVLIGRARAEAGMGGAEGADIGTNAPSGQMEALDMDAGERVQDSS